MVNRISLLLIIGFSLSLPLFEIQTSTETIQTPINIESLWIDEMDSEIESSSVIANQTSFSWNWPFIIFCIWLLGSLIMMFRMLRFLWSVYRLKTKAKLLKHQNKQYYLLDKTQAPFSFFNWIFLPEDIDISREQSILMHEENHAKQWHSIDLILTELLCIILWFNPFVFLFKSSIKTVHEFQVDALVCQNESKQTYMQLMMLNTEKLFFAGLSNHFNYLTLKKRIDMITKNKTRKFKGLLYLMFLPLLALCILAFSTDQPQKKLIEIPEIEYGILYNFSDNIENPPTLLPIRQENLTRVSSYFGMRINPVRKIKQLHTGIDYMAALGADILASASGTITKVSDKRKGFGKMIVIKHCNTYETRYAHMDGFAVKEGDKVKKGQVIGYVGNTGMSLGPHLHFEVRKNGKPVNPKDYLKEEL